jgi:hypothetical protein
MFHAKDIGDVAPPRCNLTLISRGGGCEDVPECLTKERQRLLDVFIDSETHPEKESAFQKAFQGILRISILVLIEATKEKT